MSDEAGRPDTGISWGYDQAAPKPAATPSVPAQPTGARRNVLLGGGLGVIAAIVLGVLLLGGGGSTAPSLAMAATATQNSPGYRFSMGVSVNAAGQSMNMTGSGYLSQHGHEGSLTFGFGSTTIATLISYPDVYMQFPSSMTGKLGVSTPWVKLDTTAFSAKLGLPQPGMTSGNPSQLLDVLETTGGATVVGSEQLDGVATTHLHASIPLEKYMQASGFNGSGELGQALKQLGIGTLPLDVWIDSANRVRRVELVMNANALGESMSMATTMNISDYGPQPQVTLPPASQVTDVTSQIDGAAGQLFSSLP